MNDTSGGDNVRDLRVAVIGAGMAGIASVIKLREAGIDDVTVFEKAHDVGGTWRENTYPGIACDVPSHLYSYSFAANADWTHTFSPGDEIQAYFQGVARDQGVYERTRFGEEVVSLDYDGGRWALATARGHRDEFDVVIAATGVLHHPNVPDLPGLGSFAGATFHSARWDHDVPVDGRRVGVIGTGSSAVQITGALVDRVAHLDLFQRTPQWIMPVDNTPYDEAQRRAFRDDPALMRQARDGLGQAFADHFANAVIAADSPAMAIIEEACRAHLETVADPVLREELRPDYRAGCKRLVASGEFYDAIQRPNASLVTERIERIEAGGSAHRRRRAARARRARAGHRVPLRPVPAPDPGARSRRRLPRRSSGPSVPALTSPSPSRASPTCSSSTGRTDRSGTSRSSTSPSSSSTTPSSCSTCSATAPSRWSRPSRRPRPSRPPGSRRRRGPCGSPAAAAGTSTTGASRRRGRGASITSAR